MDAEMTADVTKNAEFDNREWSKSPKVNTCQVLASFDLQNLTVFLFSFTLEPRVD